MYASLSQELFMHPLLVLFTLQKQFRKKKQKKNGRTYTLIDLFI